MKKNARYIYSPVSTFTINLLRALFNGIVAEWLSRKTRNLVPSGASVRIWPMSIFFAVAGHSEAMDKCLFD
jgi:hypothetical protein